ncbi:hypothetical protein EGK_12736, partial [Macaca mulatta]
GEKTPGQEVTVIKNMGFSVKTLAFRIEPFSHKVLGALSLAEVFPQEMKQEIHQAFMGHGVPRHYTCFLLQPEDNTLEHFSVPHSVQELQEGSVLCKVAVEPNTLCEAHLQVDQGGDLHKSTNVDPSDASNRAEGSFLSFLSIFTGGDMGG